MPDHEDRTPSFYIYPPGRWWCYGCGRGGDVVDLQSLCGNYGELWEAMVSLAVDYGVELPRRPESWHRWQDERVRRLDGFRSVLAESYRRRLFRLFRVYLAGIEDSHVREEEARRIWVDLRAISRTCAAYRIARRDA